ncbi:REV3L family protein [Megaselia abdita]
MDVFSVRLVVVDYYMSKPIPGLDPTSCEFRGREIKRVPVIRVFGANNDGVKSCMHVHGVFPYFYIPYDSSDLENVEALQYQVAGSIDKAINISVGQGSSTNSHVFKVQLVKGIPFYGFHRKEHQFLKIFMFNPRHVRKAAAMVQNGVILNKVFHPHEAHVPYVQQFMIDYNLYGMSFVHVPREILKYRKSTEDEILNYDSSQILDFNKAQKVSSTALEMDIAATFILNRFQIGSKSADNNSNPGIESIWQDERSRRKKLTEENIEVPLLEPPPFEIRTDIKLSDSHVFYKSALEKKILDSPADLTLNETTNLTIMNSQSSLGQLSHNINVSHNQSHTSKKSAFNLKKYLENSVYPEECTPESNLTNASFIQDHLSSGSSFHTSALLKPQEIPSSQLSDSVFFDDTIVDEDILMALSQTQSQNLNMSLNDQDVDFLRVMEDLEGEPDLDSTLSQLTQRQKEKKPSEDLLEQDLESSSDSDNNSLNNYTMAMEDIDDILLKLTQTSDFTQEIHDSIPQLDGNNSVPSTPSTPRRTPIKRSPKTPRTQRTPRTPRRTPRTTPRRRLSGRYIPLDMVKTSKPRVSNEIEKEEVASIKSVDQVSNSSVESFLQEVRRSKRRSMSLRKKLALNEMNKNCDTEELEIKNNKTPKRDENRLTCRLRTKSTTKKTLKTYKVDSSNVIKKFKSFDLDESSKPISPTEKVKHFLEQLSAVNTFIEDTVNLDKTDDSETTIKNDVSIDEIILASPPHRSPFRKRRKSFHHRKNSIEKTPVPKGNPSLKYDQKNDFYPEPGPSKDVPSQKSNSSIESFYEQSFMVNSPQLFSPQTPGSVVKSLFKAPLSGDTVVITPMELPPDSYEVDIGCLQFNIEEYSYQGPYFSQSEDIVQKRQIGHNVLQIPGNTLNDLIEFESCVTKGITSIRKDIIMEIEGPIVASQFKTQQSVREYVSSSKHVVIKPLEEAPSFKDCTKWLKARDNNKVEEKRTIDEDSPIKVKRQKIIMVVEDDMSGSPFDLTLTPLTCDSNNKGNNPSSAPKTITRKKSKKELFKVSQKLNVKPISNLLEPVTSQSQDKDTTTSQSSSQISNANSFKNDVDASFGISAPSLDNTYGFKVNLENLNHAKADIEYTQLTTIIMELFVESRGELLPNPEMDPISCIFYSIEINCPAEQLKDRPKKEFGFFIVGQKEETFSGLKSGTVSKIVRDELELIEVFLSFVRDWDPDVLAGYEIEMGSWGYLMDRAKNLNLNIAPKLSRVPSQKVYETDEEREQFTMMDLDTETKLCGRILLDVWRLMRSEIALTSYTFENMMFHVLHRRVPFHGHVELTSWFKAFSAKWIVLEYFLERVNGTMELLDQLDLIGRTSEMAKLIGIQFYEVLSRGSQFRVESMMLRMAKPKNLVPLSPSSEQRAHSRAPEYLPLILEPQSRMYTDPLIVLDFQSLYPSVMMAYNYCYSTCLGRVEHLGSNSPFEFGAAQLRVNPKTVKQLLELNEINISPCGAVFVNPRIREGILPKMVKEILDTRQMVKQSMKIHKNSTALQRILHSRQLGLKLMANVTYGYTAANWSGRMPCVEVGDSILSKGRETLERAIKYVEAHDEWRAKVVYGDTDSLFVLLPGRSKDEAFLIGEEIAEAVTKENPFPVKLKMEKVYLPCILQTKKRYVGFMYETVDQKEPVYEAKGIETVRRDGCPAVAKMLEKVLRILFETKDVSLVKSYVCRQFTKLLSGKANLQDLIFAKEFRGVNGYKPTACVPALEMTRQWVQSDPRNIPRRGERVPFIVTNGPPGLPLIKLVRHPSEVLANDGLIINAMYYITKAIIPPLNRCLLLIGADVHEWFAVLPRKLFATHMNPVASEKVAVVNPFGKKSTISQYFNSTNCITECGNQTKQGICGECLKDSQKVVTSIFEKISTIERNVENIKEICQSCCQRRNNISCQSLVCPVLYVLKIKEREYNQILLLQKLLQEHF